MPLKVVCIRADITEQSVDAIVNAANETLGGGAGVDGAIHRAAGPELVEACLRLPEVEPGVRCPTGQARITPGFRLPAKHVIHTVGPVYRLADDPAALLASAFRTSLELAEQHHLRTIAFPAISCGIFGYPVQEAAYVARSVVEERPWDLDEVRFVLYSEPIYEAFRHAFEQS